MSTTIENDWQEEFGIDSAVGSSFIATKANISILGSENSQGHVLRRAFELLELDGILCLQNTPLVYFKQVNTIDPAEILKLHQKFWNHGGAPILVLITPKEVQVYSGLIRPVAQAPNTETIPSLIATLARASVALREFLPAVESGEFFRCHAKSFKPEQRVDRDLLNNLLATRQKVISTSEGTVEEKILDALLCRLVFACYLFDRGVVGMSYLETIGIGGAEHLRDILSLQPRSLAKKNLYDLFRKLGDDFNGDLFSEDLDAEASLVTERCIDPLDAFFHATDVVTGQTSFWPYDFSAIPVEAISAIYERFLKGAEKKEGAFYTPRFLAELVLDVALADRPSLLGHRYLDPACGSGIFLVGLFNRMAEEWKQANPEAHNDRKARELRKFLCENLYGVDLNPTACRITAFSLYLAYLDQLSPRDIDELREKGHKLPTLVHYTNTSIARKVEGNIRCSDFFEVTEPFDIDLVIGNPPWGSTASAGTVAGMWCANTQDPYPIPDNQVSAAFVWKAPQHASEQGRMCFVLPQGILFNLGRKSVEFQNALLQQHTIDHILNLTDYQRFLFAEAEYPAVVISYRKNKLDRVNHLIEYWSPKVDWLVTRAEIIAVSPEDRCAFTRHEVLKSLESRNAPLIWKKWYWASARDRRLIDRLVLYPQLRDYVHLIKEKNSSKPWLIAEGFQPLGKGDDPAKAKIIKLPSSLFINATSPNIDLFLLPSECTLLTKPEAIVRRNRSNTKLDVFVAPHVLVSHGFTSIAYADFNVSFRSAIRGITGQAKDRELLIFLAAYLRSPIARYFLFHTSSTWGVSRQDIHIEDLLHVPFQFPEDGEDTQRSWQIIKKVSSIVDKATAQANEHFSQRNELVQEAEKSIEPLIDEYFDILPTEKILIEDTIGVLIPSARPSRSRVDMPTLVPSSKMQGKEYTERLSQTLNNWSKSSRFAVQGQWISSEKLGVAMAVLQKTLFGNPPLTSLDEMKDVLSALETLRTTASQKLNTMELVRGVKLFDRDRIFIIKPIARRFWTETAALNDADEIVGSILRHT